MEEAEQDLFQTRNPEAAAFFFLSVDLQLGPFSQLLSLFTPFGLELESFLPPPPFPVFM